jgi:hypothetical protein
MGGRGPYVVENPQLFHSCGKSGSWIGGGSLVWNHRWMQLNFGSTEIAVARRHFDVEFPLFSLPFAPLLRALV